MKQYPFLLSVIIVNYNSTEYVVDCLESIFRNCSHLSLQLIVVDNASPDNGQLVIAKRYGERIEMIESTYNRGFGGACNLGLQRAEGRYILFLNPDTVLLNDAFSPLVSYAEHYPDTALGAILLNADHQPSNSYSSFLTPWNILLSALGYHGNVHYKEVLRPLSVDFITGADLFVSHEIMDRIGGFDERFFMYCEDVDLQKRMADAGIRRIIVPGPQIVHYDGGSYQQKKKRSARRRYEADKSKMIYVKKHYSLSVYLCFRLLFLLVRIPAFINPYYKVRDNLRYLSLLLKTI